MQEKGLRQAKLGHITLFLILTGAASRILGYVREIVITTSFGQTWYTDAYKAAFLIPDFLYLILIGGAFSTAFIPVLSGYVNNNEEKEAWVVTSTILNLVLILLAVGMTFCYVFTPQLIEIMVTGFSQEAKTLAIFLTRIMLVQSFFMCLSGLAQGICHVYQQFTAPAIGSLLYNIAIILLGILLAPTIGITGFAVGVVFGAALNFVVHLPTLWRIHVRYHFTIQLRHPGVREFFRLAIPVLIGLSVIYFNTFVTQHLASNLAEGTVVLLNNANRLMQLPIGIFAIAIASAFFPTLTALVDTGDMQGFKNQLVRGVELVFFILLPASFGLAVIREPLIRALFMQGAFTAQNVVDTAAALLFFSIGIIGYSQQQILNRGFYAIRDTRSAVLINVCIIIVNIILSFTLVKPLGFRGLALAYSLAGLLSMCLLYIVLYKKVGPLGGKPMFISLFKTLLASTIMAVAVYYALPLLENVFDITTKFGQVMELTIAVLLGAGVFVLSAFLLQIDAIYEAVRLFRRKLGFSQE